MEESCLTRRGAATEITSCSAARVSHKRNKRTHVPTAYSWRIEVGTSFSKGVGFAAVYLFPLEKLLFNMNITVFKV